MMGLFTLPLTLWTETAKWTQEQLQRQGKYLEMAFRVPQTPEWTTPNRVVLDLPSLRLRKFQFPPDALVEGVPTCDIPILVITPQVNHSVICDYGPGQSLIHTILQQGYRNVYATDWKSANLDRADESLDDIVQAVGDCIEQMGGKARLLGLCQGGWMSAVYAALYPQQIEALIMAAAPIDFHKSPSGVNWMAMFYPMVMYQSLVMMGGGVMRGEFISMGFDNLRPLERYMGKFLSLWANLDDPKFIERYVRLTNWYGTSQHIPGKAYLQIVKELFKKNHLVHKKLTVHDRTVDMANITCPVYMIAGSRDHITRPEQLFAAAEHVSSATTRTYLTDAGHIGVFMSHHSLKEDWPTLLQDVHKDLVAKDVPKSP